MKRIMLLLMCASIAAACMQEEITGISPQETDDKVYASIENLGTRVQLNSDRQTVWTEKDTILVVTPEKWAYYTFDGKTGDRKGSFSLLYQDEEFVPSEYGLKTCYAFYSYNCAGGFSIDNDGGTYIHGIASPVQQYIEGSYGLQANAMLGTSNDGGNTFSFINLYGYLRLNLTGSRAVRRIYLRDNTFSTIAGSYYFPIDKPGETVLYNDYFPELTLDCGEDGVQLSDEPTEFHFALPPVEMPSGMLILVQFTDGTEFCQMTTKKVSVERNTIHPMATLDTDHNYDWQYIRMDFKGPYAISPWLYGSSSMSGWIFWGDGQRNCLDIFSWNYNYMDDKEFHQVTIKAHDADEAVFYNLDGVLKIDLSEF